MDGEYTTRGKNEIYVIPSAWKIETTSGSKEKWVGETDVN